MRVLFRADASLAIGSGHVMRCRTLAQAMRQRGHEVLFVCRSFTGHLIDLLRDSGFEVRELPAQGRLDVLAHRVSAEDMTEDARFTKAAAVEADWLVVDHYGLDARWAEQVRSAFGRILAIDDGADDRQLDCDLLLNQNLGATEHCYISRVPPAARLLLGSDWALVRPEFQHLREASCIRRVQPVCERLLVFLGGGDVVPEILNVLQGARVSGIGWRHVDVVVGAGTPGAEKVRDALKEFARGHLHIQTEQMAELMQVADFAITAGGSISWEKCCMGLPSLVVALSDNQRPIASALFEAGAALSLGLNKEGGRDAYAEALRSLCPETLAQLSVAAAALCGGDGAQKLVRLMEERKE